MVKEEVFFDNITVTRTVVLGIVVWFLGWFIFAGVEIISRKLNWFPLASSLPLLMLALYTGLGVVAGGMLGILSPLVLKSLGKKVLELIYSHLQEAISEATLSGHHEEVRYLHFWKTRYQKKWRQHEKDTTHTGRIVD